MAEGLGVNFFLTSGTWKKNGAPISGLCPYPNCGIFPPPTHKPETTSSAETPL